MLRLDASVLAAVDARAGEVGLSRQDWLRRVVEHGLLVRGVVLVESRRVRIAAWGRRNRRQMAWAQAAGMVRL